MPTQLTKLRLSELSGVDGAANEAEGWIVLKSREIKADLERFEKRIVGLNDLLVSEDADMYFNDAPESVRKAREAVADFLDQGLEVVEEPTDTKKSIGDRVKELFGVEKAGVQPVVGAEGATREEVERVTPAEVSSSGEAAGQGPTEDQGKDELGRDAEGKVVAEQDPDNRKYVIRGEADGSAGDRVQPIVGAPAETREQVERVTPAEVSSSGEAAGQGPTEDQGKDELGRDDEGKKVSEAITKAFEENVSPLAEAVGAMLERIENLEKGTATRAGIDPDLESGFEEDSLASTFRKVANGSKAVLK